jgi:hypothetical protein
MRTTGEIDDGLARGLEPDGTEKSGRASETFSATCHTNRSSQA